MSCVRPLDGWSWNKRRRDLHWLRKRFGCCLRRRELNVHGRGSKLLARELRDAGMEVIYFRFGTVEEIVSAAVQEDVDVIGVSIMTSVICGLPRG